MDPQRAAQGSAVGVSGDGATVAALAARADVCDGTLRSFLIAEGVTLRRHTPPQPKRLAVGSADLVAAYEAGATTADLAARAGVCAPTIHKFLKAQGVALRDGRGRNLKQRPGET